MMCAITWYHQHNITHTNSSLLGPAVGQEPIKFILPEFVTYLGKRAVLCVETVDISVHQFL